MTSCVSHICANNGVWVFFWQECIFIQVSVSENCPIEGFFKKSQIPPPGRRWWREQRRFRTTSSYARLLTPEGHPHSSGNGYHQPQAGMMQPSAFPRSGLSQREGTALLQQEGRKGGGQVANRLTNKTNPPPTTTPTRRLNCGCFMGSAARAFASCLLQFNLSENLKVKLLLNYVHVGFLK